MRTWAGRSIIGQYGRANEVLWDYDSWDRPDVKATLGIWLLSCPGQAAAWHDFALSIIHLRPIEGIKPAVISREGASHEIQLVALDSASRPIVSDTSTWRWLLPLNFVGQLKLNSDDQAKRCLDMLARAVVDGILWAEPPLSGQREPRETHLSLLEEHSAGKHAWRGIIH